MEIIYKLIDPETKEVRYIGRTIQELDVRLLHHLYHTKRMKLDNPKAVWFAQMEIKGVKPIIEPICFCEEFAAEIEIFYIRLYKSKGAKLLNKMKYSAAYKNSFRMPEIHSLLRESVDHN